MGQHAEDEIHREMFGCYPWEEDFESEFIKYEPKYDNPELKLKEPEYFLISLGIENRKRVYQAFERYVLEKPAGKHRKTFKMIKVCRERMPLFKKFVEMNKETFVNNKKLNNLTIPEV